MTAPDLQIKSPRDAIAMKCKDCIYDPLAPGRWREQVDSCTSTTCPLFQYRPLPASGRRRN